MNTAWSYAPPPVADALIAPDPALPQAARFMAGLRPLADAAARLGLRHTGADGELLNIWYQPGRSLDIVQRIGGDGAHQALRVRCVPPAALAVARRRTHLGDGVALVPEWSAIAHAAIHDPQLPGLHQQARDCPGAKLVSYLPGRRAVLRLPGDARPVRYAKINARDDVVARDALLRRLWHAPGRCFAMPRPLGADGARGVRWESAVQGEPLTARLASSGPAGVVRAAAEALAALHRVPPWSGLPRQGAPEVLGRLEDKVLPRVDAVLPALLPEAQALAATLRRGLTDLRLGPPVVIHGDFHAANVLMISDKIALLDLDDVSLGDPEYDLALFGGRLLLLALAADAVPHRVVEAVAALPDAYAAAGGRSIDGDVFAWYFAATMLGRQVKSCVRHLPPRAGALIVQLLELIDAVRTAPRRATRAHA